MPPVFPHLIAGAPKNAAGSASGAHPCNPLEQLGNWGAA
jgi:hypothetical protein